MTVDTHEMPSHIFSANYKKKNNNNNNDNKINKERK